MYLTEDEIITDMMLYRLDDESKRYIKNTVEEDLIMFRGTLGRWIRDYYLLWDKNNPYVVLNDTGHDMFPDQLSQRIIERIWTRLSGKTKQMVKP